MDFSLDHVKSHDVEVYRTIENEFNRQNTTLELIASENFVSKAVLEASGQVMTNKYAEGYPGRRYYGGCEHVDEVENIARDRVKKLFNAEYANVQPHSGSQANMAVYFTLVKPGDTVMGMNLAHGGHLTHGSPVNFSGKMYRIIAYGVSKETGRIDYDQVREIALKEKPKLIITGGSAYSRDIDFKAFRDIADKIGAFLMADIAHPAGLIAAKLLTSPIPYCDAVTSTTHKTLRGPRGGLLLVGNDTENRLGITAPKSGRLRMMSEVFDSNVMPGIQGGPFMHIIAAKAVAFGEALSPGFKEYARQVIRNSQTLAGELINCGFMVVSGGTDNHLMLVDLRSKSITGKDAENILEDAGITVNKNMVPFDDNSPFVTSGIRIGTAAMTTRGMKEDEMKIIAGYIDRVITNKTSESERIQVKNEITELCSKFPLYAD
jgi:glycine hydroxymethyltransferase